MLDEGDANDANKLDDGLDAAGWRVADLAGDGG